MRKRDRLREREKTQIGRRRVRWSDEREMQHKEERAVAEEWVKDRGVLSRGMHMGTKDTFCHHKHV